MDNPLNIILDGLNSLDSLKSRSMDPLDVLKHGLALLEVIERGSYTQIFPNALLVQSKEDTVICPQKPEPEIAVNESVWQVLDNYTATSPDKQSKLKMCKGCNTRTAFVEDPVSSTIVCSQCGMIEESLLDNGPEWRQYNNEEGRGEGVIRCSCPQNFFFPKSSQGTIMAGVFNQRLKKKQKWDSMMIYKEKSLNQVFDYIAQVCSKNNIPRIIVDDAKIFYKNLNDCKHQTGVNAGKHIIIRGRNRRSIIAACVFKACEKNKSPRTIKEIARFFDLDDKKITRGNKQFDKIIKNSESKHFILDTCYNSNIVEDYIKRHCLRLKIQEAHIALAITIARNCCKMKLASDHNPQSVAAGSILAMIYHVGLAISRKEVAALFGTSDVTVSKIYNKINPFIEALVNDEATDYLIKKFKING